MAGTTWRAARAWLAERPAVPPLLLIGAVLIGVASGPAAPEGAWTGVPGTGLARSIFAGLVLLLAFIGLLILVLARRGAPTDRTGGNSLVRSLVGIVTLVAILLLFRYAGLVGELPPQEESEPPPVAEGSGVEVVLEPAPGFQPGDATGLLLVLVSALIVLWWFRRPAPDPGRAAEDDSGDSADELDSSMARALRHLLDAADPRSAVLLAYRDLEETLAALALPRNPSETPTEHLRRSLTELSIDHADAGPLFDLASLYRRARFSGRAVTEADRQEAAAALDRARTRLAGSPR